MNIENIKITELKPYEKNARVHSKAQIELLKKNIERFGFTTPCLIDKENEIIAGHGRLEAVNDLGWTEVPCVRMENLSKDEVKALRIADNKLAEMAEWDMDILTTELKELPDEEFDLTGFDRDLLMGVNDFGEDFELPSGDKELFQQMTFTLSDEQAEIVQETLKKAKQNDFGDTGNENSNGNALWWICQSYE